MSVEKSLSKLSTALKKLEKAGSGRAAKFSNKNSLPGQQDLFGAGALSNDDAEKLIKKIDHTIATVETMIQQERA